LTTRGDSGRRDNIVKSPGGGIILETSEVPVNNAHFNLLPHRENRKSRSARKDKCVGHNITSLSPRFFSAFKLKLSPRIKILGVRKRKFQYFASNLQVARGRTFYIQKTFSHISEVAPARVNVSS